MGGESIYGMKVGCCHTRFVVVFMMLTPASLASSLTRTSR